jgi:hypothetical protein
MPRIKPGYLAEVPATTHGLGSSDTTASKIVFAQSPFYNGELTDQAIKDSFYHPAELEGDFINDGGYQFGLVDRKYSGTPNFDEVEVGGGGKPATPFAPNIANPVVPFDPKTIPAEGREATLRHKSISRGAFIGNGLVSPHTTKYVAPPPGETNGPGNGSGNTFINRED